MRLIALVLACACFGGGVGLPDAVQPVASGRANERQVEGVTQYIDLKAWEASPYARVTDFFPSPILVVIAWDGAACVVDGPVWVSAHRGAFVTCTTPWRLPRP